MPCGGVDVYQTDHHGVNLSNNPGLIASSTSVDGKYSILNNAFNASVSVKF